MYSTWYEILIPMFSFDSTINPLENEHIVAYALQEFPLQLLPQTPYLGEVCDRVYMNKSNIAQPGLPGCGLTEDQCKLVQRFDPSAALDTNGFFIAKFMKTKSI